MSLATNTVAAKKNASLNFLQISQSVANTNTNIFGMFFLTRIRIRIYSGSHSGPNTNIFVIIKWTEYEYLNILGSNILILFDEYSNIPWNAAIGIKFCIPKMPRL